MSEMYMVKRSSHGFWLVLPFPCSYLKSHLLVVRILVAASRTSKLYVSTLTLATRYQLSPWKCDCSELLCLKKYCEVLLGVKKHILETSRCVVLVAFGKDSVTVSFTHIVEVSEMERELSDDLAAWGKPRGGYKVTTVLRDYMQL